MLILAVRPAPDPSAVKAVVDAAGKGIPVGGIAIGAPVLAWRSRAISVRPSRWCGIGIAVVAAIIEGTAPRKTRCAGRGMTWAPVAPCLAGPCFARPCSAGIAIVAVPSARWRTIRIALLPAPYGGCRPLRRGNRRRRGHSRRCWDNRCDCRGGGRCRPGGCDIAGDGAGQGNYGADQPELTHGTPRMSDDVHSIV